MGAPEFVHLHAHSDYSLLDGMARFSDGKGKPTPMLQRLARQGFTHQALTDHGNLFGAVEFYQACREAGLTPIVGCELYVASGSRHDRKSTVKDDENPQKSSINHLTVLARDNEGYNNLIELVTKASLEGFYYKPRVDREILAKHSAGLLALSGCLKGEVAQAVLADNAPLAAERAKRLADIFGPGNFYLEIMDHGLDAQQKVGRAVFDLARLTGLPVAATNDCHYFQKDEADAHDALLCIGTGKKIEDTQRLRYASSEFYYKSPQEMHKLFGNYPEVLKNTVKIAHACAGLSMSFGELRLPDYQVPEGYTQESFLRHLCVEGLKKRFPAGSSGAYQERLEHELGVVKKMGFPGYFLIVWDFINFARSRGIPVGPGRGSGAGSLVSYLLNITSVDPLEYGLLFERFLNPNRREMPDLDIDFSDEGREQVIHYVREKYGFTNVAQIITFGTMASRAVVRDVGRVLNVPLGEVDKIAKAIPPNTSIEAALKTNPEFKALVDQSPAAKKILSLAVKLEGVRRHAGIHAAGTVITKEPVTRYTPLYKNPTSGAVTTGYNDKSLLSLGLLKVDFLGLQTLTVIQRAVELVSRHRGIEIDLEKLSYDDPKTFELLGRAQTGGVFQLESSGMRKLLIKLKPSKLTDIIALIALFRPGPMKWIDEFCGRKNGALPVRYGHPLLEPILQETYGITIYQEQVMEISKRISGFTAAQADSLRKAMGKKIPAELDKLESKFLEGAKANKVDPRFAEKLYEDLKDFGFYAFNKSHSTAYGILAYQTAYLKANFPIEFMTALVNSEIGRSAIGSEEKENKVATYLGEAREMGFGVRAPDVNHSEARFSIEENNIRFGLLAIKNIGDGTAAEIVRERERAGDYKGITDFFMRLPKGSLNKKVVESLGKAGALDGLLEGAGAVEKRSGFVPDADYFIAHFSDKAESLFDMGVMLAPRRRETLGEDQILLWEREILGMYLTIHPLRRWEALMRASGLPSIQDLKGRESVGDTVQLLGMVSATRKQLSKRSGLPWSRVKIEDLNGIMETLIFPRAYAEIPQELLRPGAVIAVLGRLSRQFTADEETGELEGASGGDFEIIAQKIVPIENFLSSRVAFLQISLDTAKDDRWPDVDRILQSAGNGATAVRLVPRSRESRLADLWVEHPKKISLDQPVWEELEAVAGREFLKLACAAPEPAAQESRRSYPRNGG